LNSFLQILAVSDVKKGTSKKTGNPYEIQEAECLMLDDNGQPTKVGVLMLPKMLNAKQN
jgi:hypothetical protein